MSQADTSEAEPKPMCGIVMPISSIDGCSEAHWQDVLTIIEEAVHSAGFQSTIVSQSDESGSIHKRIIQNLYENPIVVVDVSGKNPNVMFELGMRLAFDKPTVIIKDDKTSYSFDTSSIEHIEYPRDLRFTSIVDFKIRLSGKVKSTYERSKSDKDYTTFLKHFGSFTVAKIDSKEIPAQDFILEELKSIKLEVEKIGRAQSQAEDTKSKSKTRRSLSFSLAGINRSSIPNLINMSQQHPSIHDVTILTDKNDMLEILVTTNSNQPETVKNVQKFMTDVIARALHKSLQEPQ